VCYEQKSAKVGLDMEIKNHCTSTEKLLMTISGVGHIIALTFTSEIGKPGRFQGSRKVGAIMHHMMVTGKQFQYTDKEQGKKKKTA